MLVANVITGRLSCCQPDRLNLLQMADPSRWQTRHMIYGIPYAMLSHNTPRQIYRIPTYMEFYTPTRLDIKSSLINLVKNPPPAPGSLFLGVASRSASGRDLTRVPKPNSNISETNE